jgi:hypothetical protein
MLRVPGGIEHVADGLTNWQAWGLAELDFSMVTPKALLAGRTLEADTRQKEPIKPKVAERGSCYSDGDGPRRCAPSTSTLRN